MIKIPLGQRPGLTLVECLVVFAILTVLLTFLVVSIGRSREAANQLVCQHNLHQLVLAVHAYHQDKGTMPPYASGRGEEIFGSWFVHLLPYTGFASLFQEIRNHGETNEDGVRLVSMAIGLEAAQETIFANLLCPTDGTAPPPEQRNKTSYLANWYGFGDGTRGPYSPPQKFSQLTDGLSNLVLFAEGFNQCDGLPRLALMSTYHHNFGITQEGKPSDDPSYLPDDYTMFQVQPNLCDQWRTQTAHAVMPVGLADGSVRPMKAEISPVLWKHLLKPRDGEPRSGEW
jgi:hypothetical protein